jgi:hypothetical protein
MQIALDPASGQPFAFSPILGAMNALVTKRTI